MTPPLETSELLAFATIVESKSLTRAAEELGVPRATIGRRLARLEERLGARLVRRTTRSLSLTDAGETFYRHARIVLDAAKQAEASVQSRDETIRGELRVSVPPISDPDFYRCLGDFAERYPEVRLQVHFSTEHVDLLRGGYDVAIRATNALEPGLVARTLIRAPMFAVAAPAYLAEWGTPRTLRDLREHRCLSSFTRGAVRETHWPLAGGGRVQVESWFVSNDIQLLLAMALRGLGIAFLPETAAGGALSRGDLTRVLPNQLTAEARVAIVYPEREFLPPAVRAFTDAFAAWVPELLEKRRDKEVALTNGASPKTKRRSKSAARARPKRRGPGGA